MSAAALDRHKESASLPIVMVGLAPLHPPYILLCWYR
jgi:hypothetical protein